MKRFIYVTLCALFFISLIPITASARPDHAGGGNKPDKPKNNDSTAIGYDVSWPQCGKSLPSDHAFGIVGVNGGTAANTNPCLSDQLV